MVNQLKPAIHNFQFFTRYRTEVKSCSVQLSFFYGIFLFCAKLNDNSQFVEQDCKFQPKFNIEAINIANKNETTILRMIPMKLILTNSNHV